jgi:hypothetical protein
VVTDTTSIVWDWATGGQAKATRAALTGDVTASADSNATTIANNAVTTAKILDANVTLAKMADLAQDQFIGRTTASTGVPQTATITAAARTVLDDTTVAAMLATMGGAPLASPTFTGTVTLPADQALTGNPTVPTQASGNNSTRTASTAFVTDAVAKQKEVLIIAASDETTTITTGTAKVTFRMPFAMTLTEVRASLTTVSSSGNPAFDLNEGGASVFSTTLTIDANEKTSTTAATPAVISDASLADDAEMTVDIDTAGTGAKGVKIYLIGTRT